MTVTSTFPFLSQDVYCGSPVLLLPFYVGEKEENLSLQFTVFRMVLRELHQRNVSTSGPGFAHQIPEFKSMLKKDEIWGFEMCECVLCLGRGCKYFVAKRQTLIS